MLQSSFRPEITATRHIGQKQATTSYTWEEWNRRFAPRTVRCVEYIERNDKIISMTERIYHNTQYVGSVTQQIERQMTKFIILNWEYDPIVMPEKGYTFLNMVLPIPSAQRFHNGVVGIGLGRWLKTLFMILITAAESERPRVVTWYRALVTFVHRMSTVAASATWFDVAREMIRSNENVEDILVMKLLQAILDEPPIPRLREFRLFEISVHRSSKRHNELKDNLLMPIVWLYADMVLVKDEPDLSALDHVFQLFAQLRCYDNMAIMQMLIMTLFPELVQHTTDIWESIRMGSPWVHDTDTIVFSDGSRIVSRRQSAADRPFGLRTLGTVEMIVQQGDTHVIYLTAKEYNWYCPVMMNRPSGDTTLEIDMHGRIIPFELTSKHGPGVVFRGLNGFVTQSRAFQGIMGISLNGGFGDGRGPPTQERVRPICLSTAVEPALEVALCHVVVSKGGYSVTTSEWAQPLRMTFGAGQTVFGIFFKGFRDLRVEIRATTPSSTRPGMRFRELLEQGSSSTPFQRLQNRAMRIS